MSRTRAILLFGALLLTASLAWGPTTSTASDTAEPSVASQIVLRPRGGHRRDTASAWYRRHVPGAAAGAVSSPAINRAIQVGLAEEDTGQGRASVGVGGP